MTRRRRAKDTPGQGRPAEGSAEALEAALGYSFRDPALLRRALTHASAVAGTGSGATAALDNERMEFLGDRVLGLIIADALLETFPAATEGELAPRLNRLVRRETCAAVGRDIGLGAALHLAPAEAAQGGRDKMAILGNAMEAVIAALYLDGGLEAARGVVRRLWEPHFEAVAEVPRDAKTRLQEHLHARGQEPPAYRVTSRAGPDHAPVFEIEADAGPSGRARGQGPSKRAAEQAAAAALLAQLEQG